jgi:cytidine deaminase
LNIEEEINSRLNSKCKTNENLIEKLINEAKKASSFSYSPYSKFAVGSSLLLEKGDILLGCNVENSSYGATMCSERVVIFKAISAGVSNFLCLCVYNKDILPYPCGCCLQVMSEFVNDDFPIILVSENEKKIVYFSDLLGYPFKLT